MRKNEVPERVLTMRREWAANDALRDKDNVCPKGVCAELDLRYSDYEEFGLLDLYRPEDCIGKLPVMLSIHGGGYFYGDKELYRFFCMDIAARGFAVIDFNYRLAPEYRFPAPLEDINSVLAWAVVNADKYNLDVKNVFLAGDSAGAQLTSHYAAIWSNPSFATLFDFEVPEVVIRGICPACGMYDLKKRMDGLKEEGIMLDYFGGDFDCEDKRVEVLQNITKDYPPAFVFSSFCDFLYTECEPMAEFLKGKGVEAVSRIYGSPDKPEIGHVFHVDFRYPDGEAARSDQAEFMRQHIRSV